MSRVLLDENVPIGLRTLLRGHDVTSVQFQGWKGLANGALLAAARSAGFQVFVTCDRNLRYQQMPERTLAVVVLPTPQWKVIKANAVAITCSVDRAKAGRYEEVVFVGPS